MFFARKHINEFIWLELMLFYLQYVVRTILVIDSKRKILYRKLRSAFYVKEKHQCF